MSLEVKTVITEGKYDKYIGDFNAACAGDGSAFGDFYDRYYEPDAIFEQVEMKKPQD
jgi:hypothetical protein